MVLFLPLAVVFGGVCLGVHGGDGFNGIVPDPIDSPVFTISPNPSESLCFDAEYTRERCCVARDAICFRQEPAKPSFIFEECCNESEISWWGEMFARQEIDAWMYTISDFYTDAQYGEDFGYYYRGRVLLNGTLNAENSAPGNISLGFDAEEHPEGFAHYTTFPMALSPHFGGVLCRKLFVMWSSMGEPEEFPVFEFGAGSGQLASDIRELCGNFNGEISDKLSTKSVEHAGFGKVMNKWGSRKFLRFRRAVKYAIVERSLALVHRQRNRGHEVIIGDAQETEKTCAAVRKDRKFQDAVIISNELIDAFAPAKLRLTVGNGNEEISDCKVWQETRVLHLSSQAVLRRFFSESEMSEIRRRSREVISDLHEHSAVVRTARAVLLRGDSGDWKLLETSELVGVVLAVTSLADYGTDLRLPIYAHDMVLRIRRDRKLRERLQFVYEKEKEAIEKLLSGGGEEVVVVEKDVYRSIRKQLRGKEKEEVEFIKNVLSRRVNGPLTAERCKKYESWMQRHKNSIFRVQQHYRSLGYYTTQFGVRLGEEAYMKLVDCIIGSNRGYVLSIDYGANFEALANSISSTPMEDGVSVPPIPPALLTEGLPSDCQANWLSCPGFIDYTSFIDFTNIAKTGEELGFFTVLYGPQSSLERNLELSEGERNDRKIPPRWEVKDHLTHRTQWRHVTSWYGNENLPGVQRWTSFKVLVQGKNLDFEQLKLANEWTVNWPISIEHVDNACFRLDFTAYPQTDVVWRTPDGWQNLVNGNFKYSELLEEYNDMYEEAHLAMQLTDFLEGALSRGVFCSIGQTANGMEIAWWKIKGSRWQFIWPETRIAKILDLLFKHVFTRPADGGKLEPGICLARRKFEILCGSLRSSG